VLFSFLGRPGRLRAVTHLGVSADEVEAAIAGAARALAPVSSTA
jgi:hypothetical protein